MRLPTPGCNCSYCLSVLGARIFSGEDLVEIKDHAGKTCTTVLLLFDYMDLSHEFCFHNLINKSENHEGFISKNTSKTLNTMLSPE